MFEGVQYFKSRAGRGKFVQLQILQPDKRFMDVTASRKVFKVGSRVQYGMPKEYGVIKWIGSISDANEEYVKVETVSYNYKQLICVCIHTCIMYVVCVCMCVCVYVCVCVCIYVLACSVDG